MIFNIYLTLSIIILLFIWGLTFSSKLWNTKLPVQLLLFILPIFLGLINLILLLNIFPFQLIKLNRSYIYFYSSINLLLLIPQWYKLAWTKLLQARNCNWKDTTKLVFIVLYAVFMVFAMVFFFAIYYFWINLIAGNKQCLLTAVMNYHPISLDFSTSIYFSFVTYFTLGYGDLVPYGFWMRTFVFLECLASVLNTGIIAVYVYNFLFYQAKENQY